MRKFFDSIVFLFAISLLVACSDDTNTPPGYHESNLSVVSQNVVFGAAGGEGEITVNSDNAISAIAESQGDWISLNVQDNTIKVTTKANPSLEGRSSRILISSGQDTTSVTAQQLGLTMSLERNKVSVNRDAATDVSVAISNSNPVEVSSDNDWVTPELVSDSIVLHFSENTSGSRREGTVTVQSGDYVQTIDVEQYEFAKDLTGLYMLLYTELTDAGQLEGPYYDFVRLTTTGLQFLDQGYTMPLTIDQDSLILRSSAGSYMGTYKYGQSTFQVYNFLMVYTGQGIAMANTSDVSTQATIQFGALTSTPVFGNLFTDEDKGTYASFQAYFQGTYPILGFVLGLYRNTSSFEAGNAPVGTVTMIYPTLVRPDATAGAKVRRSAKRQSVVKMLDEPAQKKFLMLR